MLVFILSSLSALANTNYSELGQDNQFYNLGFGNFNAENIANAGDPVAYGRALQASEFVPLVADLNNDGIQDIVIIDNGFIKIYKDKELVQQNSYNMGTTERTSNIIIFDIDGDGSKEIILAQEISEVLRKYNYNGTAIYEKPSVSLAGLTGHNNGEMLIKCSSPDVCMMTYAPEYTNTVTGASVTQYAVGFNSTAFGTAQALLTYSSGAQVGVFCYPKIKNIVYENFDSHTSTDFEYIFSTIFSDTGAGRGEWLNVFYVNRNNISSFTIKKRVAVALGDILEPTIAGGSRCDIVNTVSETADRNMDAGGFVTSPLVADFNGPSSDGKETAVAFNRDNNEYKMFLLDASTGTATILGSSGCPQAGCLDDYPEVLNSQGEMLSNPIKMNAFPNKAEGTTDLKNDFCLLGYNNVLQLLELTCGSMQNTYGLAGYESLVYRFYTNGTFNTTRTAREFNSLVHAIDESREPYLGTNNMDELLNPYGVMELQPIESPVSCLILGNCDACWYSGICRMGLIYTNPKPDSVLLSVDMQKVGFEDLLALQQNNIWYIDDRYSNSPADILEYSIDPCLNSIWKVNTTVSINILTKDIDGDLVSARAILYDGTSYAQDMGWSENYSSGEKGISIPFNYVANVTVNNAQLTMMVRDSKTLTGDIISQSFSVGTSGVVFGDCITRTIVSEPEANVTPIFLLPDQNNNAISKSLQSIDDSSGANLGVTVWYIIGMIALTIFIYATPNIKDEALKFWAMILANTGALIIGGMIGVIGFAILFLYGVVLAGAVVLWIKNRMTSTPGG